MSCALARTYGQARLCGQQARARLGPRARALIPSGRIGEFWHRLFAEAPPSLPESLLAAEAEGRVRRDAGRALLAIGGKSLGDDRFFRALLSKSEFNYVKLLLAALRRASGSPPEPVDLLFAPRFQLEGYPDLVAMFGRGGYSWIAELGFDDLPAAKNRLDRQYYEELWRSLAEVPRRFRGSLRRFLFADIEVENLIWALRLRRYYGLPTEEIVSRLVHLRTVDPTTAALGALGRRPDLRSDWADWKWETCLNPVSAGSEIWRFDLRYFERALRRRRFAELRRGLHLQPFSYVPPYCFFRIKEYETAALFGVIEGLQLEVQPDELAEFIDQIAVPGS